MSRNHFVVRRRALVVGTALACAMAAPAALAAEKFPSKPIEIVIHSKYGGGNGLEPIQERKTRRFHRSFIIR